MPAPDVDVGFGVDRLAVGERQVIEYRDLRSWRPLGELAVGVQVEDAGDLTEPFGAVTGEVRQ